MSAFLLDDKQFVAETGLQAAKWVLAMPGAAGVAVQSWKSQSASLRLGP